MFIVWNSCAASRQVFCSGYDKFLKYGYIFKLRQTQTLRYRFRIAALPFYEKHNDWELTRLITPATPGMIFAHGLTTRAIYPRVEGFGYESYGRTYSLRFVFFWEIVIKQQQFND